MWWRAYITRCTIIFRFDILSTETGCRVSDLKTESTADIMRKKIVNEGKSKRVVVVRKLYDAHVGTPPAHAVSERF